MKIISPIGARLLVELIEPVDTLAERAAKSGLFVAQFNSNLPKPTTGKVVALGSDPEVQRLFKIGDIVYFNKYAGTETYVEGRQYRTLEFQEVTNLVRELPDEVQPATNQGAEG